MKITGRFHENTSSFDIKHEFVFGTRKEMCIFASPSNKHFIYEKIHIPDNHSTYNRCFCLCPFQTDRRKADPYRLHRTVALFYRSNSGRPLQGGQHGTRREQSGNLRPYPPATCRPGAPGQPFYDLSKGVALMAGSCSHEEDNAHNHAHEGVEPHIWNSVKNARIIANNIFQALSEIDNEQTPYYQHRLDSLLQVIDNTGKEMDTLMENADRTFLIYHPALTYFARDYGLNQISIEADGKEPSPAHLKELIQLCREEQPKIIFVQKEFDTRNAEIIARELQVNVIPINPLSYHWNEEMINIAKALSNP